MGTATTLKGFQYFISSCLLVLIPAFCFAQTVTFSGKIVNENNLVLANVSLLAKQQNLIKTYTQTDSYGHFSLLLNEGQHYTIQISSVGYKTLEIMIPAAKTKTDSIYILQQQIKIEDTVKITTKRGYYENGDTLFYNTDVYKRNNENNLKDLLNNLPGVQVSQAGRITVDGQTVDKILVDGKDLTGDDYEKIVNNLSPHNLDQIQVLKKYRDPFSLSATATGDTEVAINLTFKKKKLIPSARLALSLGLPIDYFEEKTDFLITQKKITGLCFIDWNTVGNSYQFIASPNSILGNFNPGGFSKLGKGLSFYNGVNELYLPIERNFYSFNHSTYFDNSSQISFSKNTTDKFTITFAPEKIEQTETRLSQTFAGNQLFSETRTQKNPVIDNNRFIIKNELIWMLQPKQQLKIESSFVKENFGGTSAVSLNNTPAFFTTGNGKKLFSNLVNYATYLKKNRLFNAAFLYESEKNNEQLYTEGVAYDGILFSNTFGPAKNLNQQKLNREYNIGGYLKFIQYTTDHSITIQPTYRQLKGNFYSNLSATSSSGAVFNTIDSFHNRFDYTQNSLSLPIRYKYNDDHDIIDFSAYIEPFIWMRQRFYAITSNNYTDFNASAELKYNFKSKRALGIRASKTYTITNASQMPEHNIITGNTNILTPPGFLPNTGTYDFGATFQNKTFNKKSKNSYGLRYNINDPNFIYNITSYNLFSYYSYLPFNNSNSSFNAFIRNELNLKKLKLRLDQNLQFNLAKNYSSQNQLLVYGTTHTITLDNRVKSKFDGVINFDWNNSFNYLNSKIKSLAAAYSSYINTSKLLINLNYMKKMNLDFSVTHFYSYTPYNKKAYQLLFANASFKALLHKNKIRCSLDFNNITNTRKFGNQVVSATRYTETSTILIPFFLLAKIELLL